MVGYSETPLVKKLGIKDGYKIFVKNYPLDYEALIGQLPLDVKLLKELCHDIDMVHLFVKSHHELVFNLEITRDKIRQSGMIWVSWPKKASNISTDITEDKIRDAALPMGFVDTKVCAVDDVWSGLKLVIRKKFRT